MNTIRTLDDYLDAAIRRQGLKSDRDLGRALGMSGGPVCQWRTKRSWPTDDRMRQIAELAGVDPHEAVIRLNIWRNLNTPVAKVYSDILAKLTGLAASFLLFVGILAPGHADARTHGEQINIAPMQSVYYDKTRYFVGAPL